MIQVTTKVDGFAQLDEALKMLPDEVQRKEVRSALRKAARVISDDASQRAPVHAAPYEGPSKAQKKPGTLRHSIAVRLLTARSAKDAVTARISVKKAAWYGRLVEFGHRIVPRLPKGDGVRGSAKSMARRQARKAAHARGQNVPAKPFLRPAFDAKGNEAVSVFADALGTGIARAWARLYKRPRGRGRR